MLASLLAAIACVVVTLHGQEVDDAATDPFVLVEASVGVLPTITGGEFTTAVAMDDDAFYVVATAPVPVDGAAVRTGSAYGFIIDDDAWVLDTQLLGEHVQTDARFGESLAFGGNLTVIGAPRTDITEEDQGAVYLFSFRVEDDGVDPTWEFIGNLTVPALDPFAQFGSAVSTDGSTVVVGAPFADFGVAVAGRVFVYSSAAAVFGGAPTELVPPTPEIAAGYGFAVAVGGNLVAVGEPFADGPAPGLVQDVGKVHVYRSPDNGTTWPLFTTLSPTSDAVLSRRFGLSLWIWGGPDIARLLVGSPGSTAEGVADAGSAMLYMFSRDNQSLALEAVLFDPQGPGSGDEFGFKVVVRETNALVSAPARGVDDIGAAYLFRTFNGSDWFARVRVNPLDGTQEDRFGQSVAMGIDRAIVGTPKHTSFQGAAYQYDGPEFFPLGLPTFSPPAGVYFVEFPFVVTIMSARPNEQDARYELGEENFPVTRDSPIAVNNTVTLPVQTGVRVDTLSAISAGTRFISFPVTWSYTISGPTPGMWWDVDGLTLRNCGSPEFYCPGVVGDNDRHLVSPGYYTLPINTPNMRTMQRPCEDDSFCVEGIQFLCDTPVCWPLPIRATAHDNPSAGGTTEETEGLTDGDTITVYFNKPTNFANVNGHANLTRLFNFTTPIGSELTGQWLNDSTVLITIINATGAGDPELTRIGAIGFTLEPEGGLKMEANRTRATRTTEPFLIENTWGKVDPPPALVSAVAAAGRAPQAGFGPGNEDTLTVTFDKLVRQPPISTQAQLDTVLEFTPPLTDVNYTGEWLSWTEFRVYFANLTEREPEPWPSQRDLRSQLLGRMPDLFEYPARVWPTEPTYRAPWSVGSLLVSVKNGSNIMSRDRSSDPTDNSTIVVSGSWGDTPGRVNANYESPSSFWVNWLPSASMFNFQTPLYWVQVRKGAPFATVLPQQPTEDGSDLFFNATVPRDGFLEDNNLDYRFLVQAETFEKYYIRVFAFNLNGDWGPARVSDPEAMIPQPVEVRNVKGGRNIPLDDGLVLLETTNVGTGQNVRTLPVSATMVNGTGGRSYLATNCEFDLDGSSLVCDAPPGVGANFQWEVTVNGHRGIISPPETATQTSFYPPVVAGFRTDTRDLLKTTDNAFLSSVWIDGTGAISEPLASLGGEVIRVYGRNFGRIGLTWGVRAWAWPRSHPDVIITMRNCQVVNDHIEMLCTTPAGAGANMEWAVSVGGQTSVRTTSAYDEPKVLGVYHNVAVVGRPAVVDNETVPEDWYTLPQAELGTAGGTELRITGLNLGPPRDDIVPILGAVPASFVGQYVGDPYEYVDPVAAEHAGKFSERWPNTHPVFVSTNCRITALNTNIRCAAPEGFGGPIQMSVWLLGSASPVFHTNLSYTLPTMDSLAEITINETVTTNSTTEITSTTTSLYLADVARTLPQPEAPTDGGVNEWAVYGHNLAGAHPANVGVLFDGEDLRPSPLSHEELRVRLPPGTGTGHRLQVIVGGFLTDNVLVVDYAPPEVHSFNLQGVEDVDGVGQVPCFGIAGANFGGPVLGPGDLSVTIADRPCDTVSNVTHVGLVCCSAVWRGPVVVTVDNQTSVAVVLEGEALDVPPVLSGMTPLEGDTNAADELILTGSGFSFPVDAFVEFEGVDMSYEENSNIGSTTLTCVKLPLPADVDSNTQLRCRLPFASGPSLTARVYRHSVLDLGTLSSEATFTYTFNRPNVLLTTPSRIPDDGGILTVVGRSFGTRGAVLFRGLTVTQDALAIVETRPPDSFNESSLVEETEDQLDVLDGVVWAALPRCAPVILWTHNRVECWVHPSRVPRGALELNVGWEGSDPEYPGLLFETDLAGLPPSLTDEDLYFAHLQPEPTNMVGSIYYPGLELFQDSDGNPTTNAASGMRPWGWALAVVVLVSAVLNVL